MKTTKELHNNTVQESQKEGRTWWYLCEVLKRWMWHQGLCSVDEFTYTDFSSRENTSAGIRGESDTDRRPCSINTTLTHSLVFISSDRSIDGITISLSMSLCIYVSMYLSIYLSMCVCQGLPRVYTWMGCEESEERSLHLLLKLLCTCMCPPCFSSSQSFVLM